MKKQRQTVSTSVPRSHTQGETELRVEYGWEKSSVIGGAVQVAVGVAFLIGAFSLEIGHTSRMGPGYFPLILSLVFIGLGIATVLAARRPKKTSDAEEAILIAWWPAIFVFAGIGAFALLIERLGFIPAVALAVAVTRLADRRVDWKELLALVLVMLLINWLIFVALLGMPLSLWKMPF